MGEMGIKNFVIVLLVSIIWTGKIVSCHKIFGSFCTLQNDRNTGGVCQDIRNCTSIISDLHAGTAPVVCDFQGNTDKSIVCCPTEKRISELKCEEYMNILLDQNSNPKRIKCNKVFNPLITGGRDVLYGEFPHQAALGYTESLVDKNAKTNWLCGGTLISDSVVMTAAHCVRHSDQLVNVPNVILLGDNELHGSARERQIIFIEDILIHPTYKPPFVYNDIALIKLSKKVKLSKKLRPACLPQGNERFEKIPQVSVTGFGKLGTFESQSEILQVTNLTRYGVNECNTDFTDSADKVARFPKGVFRTQVCAGDKSGPNDSCSGDSGSPMVVNKKGYECIFAVGIVSFGSKYCGLHQPGVYTNVQSYLDWIEDNVWPLDPSKPWPHDINIEEDPRLNIKVHLTTIRPINKKKPTTKTISTLSSTTKKISTPPPKFTTSTFKPKISKLTTVAVITDQVAKSVLIAQQNVEDELNKIMDTFSL